MIGFRPRGSALYLERPRLLQLLPDSEGFVVWCEAPYGYGKSVLAAQWAERLEGEGWRVLWLSAKGRDLKTALAELVGLPSEILWGTLLDSLWQQPTLLVLEDLEGSEDINLLLKEVRGLLLLASRAPLPFPELLRLTTQGRLIQIRARHLAFMPEEASALFADQATAKQAWERSQGWPLPLHFASLTGESPEPGALLEGVRESLSTRAWQEALFLSALPYLPFETASGPSRELAGAGFAQELETGFRLHPLAADMIRHAYPDDMRAAVRRQRARLPLVLQAEALATAQLLGELDGLMEDNFELGASDPEGLLRWDSLCSGLKGPGRLLALAWAQSTLGKLDAARESYRAVVHHEAATPDQRLTALGWWIFDVPLHDHTQVEALLRHATTVFPLASRQKIAYFLFNASGFFYSNHDWARVESLLQESLRYLEPGSETASELKGVHLRLAQVWWELQGDVETLLTALEDKLRFPSDNPYNVPVNHATLGRYRALLSDLRAVHHFEQAEGGASRNLASAILASAEKAALLGRSESFPALAAQCRTWQAQDPAMVDRVYALWARALRLGGQAQAALNVLENAVGLSSQAECALALAELGKHREALATLPQPETSKQRFIKLELQAARYLLTGDEADLDVLLNLTLARERVLPALVPLPTLPRLRPELSRVYPLREVLASGWREAVALRQEEIPDLEMKLLGHFRVRVLDHEVELTDKHKALLALMALGYDREVIGDALWPDVEGKKVRNNLHVQLNLLRKALEPWGLRTYLTEGGLARTQTDLWELQKVLDKGDAGAVLQFYREPLAPGVDVPLLDEARDALRERVVEILYTAAQGTEDPAVYLERLLELDPLHEEALQHLLKYLVTRGRTREAARRYQKFARRLKDETGLEPLPETQRLLP